MVRRLAERKGLLGAPNNGTLVASNAWVGREPARTLRVSRRLHPVAAMDYSVNVEGMTPREAARRWIERNPRLMEAWLQQG